MAAAVSSVSLPDSIIHAAEVQARLSGVSLEKWISLAVASKLDTDEGAHEFFRSRAEGAKPADIQEIFEALPKAPPMPGDELE